MELSCALIAPRFALFDGQTAADLGELRWQTKQRVFMGLLAEVKGIPHRTSTIEKGMAVDVFLLAAGIAGCQRLSARFAVHLADHTHRLSSGRDFGKVIYEANRVAHEHNATMPPADLLVCCPACSNLAITALRCAVLRSVFSCRMRP